MEPKDELKEVFQYAIYKLDNNLCTPAEIDTFADAAKTVLNLEGEIKDFSKFYGVPEGSIRAMINMKVFDKPRRNVVLYKFRAIMKAVPEKWRKKK